MKNPFCILQHANNDPQVLERNPLLPLSSGFSGEDEDDSPKGMVFSPQIL